MSGRLAGRLEQWMPGLRILARRRRSWVVHDLVAGLILTARWSRLAWATPGDRAPPDHRAVRGEGRKQDRSARWSSRGMRWCRTFGADITSWLWRSQ